MSAKPKSVDATPLAWTGLDDPGLQAALKERALTLTVPEARRLLALIGRDPTAVEARLFDILWSEHCSYKSSRPILKRFPTEGPEVLIGPGEDAGVVHLGVHQGERFAVVVGHESHNHPSQVLPVEGAATGIGGIVRDVFCMGAEVVGVLDALRFGDPQGPAAVKVRDIAQGVVEGIMEYGNALGVPNLGGDVFFDRSFDDNCLVNVVAIGVCKEARIIRSRAPESARNEEHVLILVGKPTDRTGFGGASFASAGLDADRAHEQKGAVQVHDPFLKRVLFEATNAVFELTAARGIEIGFKDLGAGGLACAAVELAAAAGMGMAVDLSAVPTDVPGHPPEVIACAETQERFALVVPAPLAPEILAIYNQEFELPALYPGAGAAVVGKVLPEDRFLLRHRKAVVGDLKATAVTAGIVHERQAAPLAPALPLAPPPAIDPGATLVELLSRPNLASREFIFRGYDTDVRGRAVVRPGEGDAGVIAPVAGAPFGLAVAVGGIPAYGLVDPYLAGVHAALEAMRNVAATGATPIALTDCLNYGSPEDPAVFAAFVAGVDGIAAAARGIGLAGEGAPEWPVPVVSGNVSFYNHSAAGRAIAPSPIVAAIGRLDDWSRATTLRVKTAGSRLVLVGARGPELGGSELVQARGISARAAGPLPPVDFARERAALYTVIELIRRGDVRAAHDIGAGGLAVAVTEMLLGVEGRIKLGAELELGRVAPELELAPLLFGEAPGYLLEVPAEKLDGALARCAARGVMAWDLGPVTGTPRLRVTRAGTTLFDLELEPLSVAHRGALPALMG